ncbi:MAG: hypothetical protein L0271_12615 [Gemmatimonadetes bacterium]|nr:hypothetical protein [Gemmatimonadota bacterium]
MTTSDLARRKVRFHLRNGRQVEGNIHVNEGNSLALWLTTRHFFANLTEARWVGTEDELSHLAVRADQILWGASLDGRLPVSGVAPPVSRPRWAEIVMGGDSTLHVALYIADDQRLTDYVDAVSGFMPVLSASLLSRATLLGEIAVNTRAILAMHEIGSDDERGVPRAARG